MFLFLHSYIDFRAKKKIILELKKNYFRAGRAQPDNREGDEFCLAVLNNFYADGIRFHDVSCHHKKPVICEA